VAEPTAVAAAELPQTSSRLPLIALLGLLALGAGLALRRV
jgi:LPXTG-motif cell wall-anchored protein